MTDHTRTEKIDDDSIYFCDHPSRARNRYDNPNCRVRIDSDENKTKCSNGNIWYSTDENDNDRKESTYYDFGIWIGNASFDDHNEADLIADEPIDAPPIET